MQPTNIIEGVWQEGVEVKVQDLRGMAFTEEAGAHKFVISALDAEGAETTFSGTVSAHFLRADNTTVAIDGAIESGKATVTLVADCYHVAGRYSIAVYISDGTNSACVYAAVGNIFRTTSDVVIDSGATIPTLAQLQAAYAACLSATENADDALAYLATAESTTAASKAYSVGDFLIYNGKLYQVTTAIASGGSIVVSGSGQNVSQTVFGDQVSDLKNQTGTIGGAFNENEIDLALAAFTTGKYIASDGTVTDNASTSYTSVAIESADVGTKLFISGSAWYSVKPYVFVGTSTAVTYAPVVSPGSTITQYTDLEFTPTETGTLYINRYASGSNVQTARAYYKQLGTLKTAYIPSDAGDSITDAIAYSPVSLGTLIDTKLLNAVTGEITDGSSDTQRITDYIEVTGSTYYLITTEMYYGYALYVWYDENKTYISGLKAESGSSQTQIFCSRVKSPANAAYLVIGYIYQNNFPFPFLMAGTMNAVSPSNRWYGKKWTGLGDSLTAAYTVTGAHYFDLIRAATGITFVNKGVSGSGYAKGTSNFMATSQTVDSDTDVVTIFGSGNDASSGLDLGDADDTGTSTIAGCINTTLDNLYTINPIMNIGVITPTPWKDNMPSDDGFMERYSNLIVEICKLRGIPCLDLYHCSGLNPNSSAVRSAAYSRDGGGGVHPDENGHALFAPRIQAFMDSLLIH